MLHGELESTFGFKRSGHRPRGARTASAHVCTDLCKRMGLVSHHERKCVVYAHVDVARATGRALSVRSKGCTVR